MKQKKKLFARGTFSYRVLWISIIYLFLFASVIAPITKIEGENRSTFILISVAIILDVLSIASRSKREER